MVDGERRSLHIRYVVRYIPTAMDTKTQKPINAHNLNGVHVIVGNWSETGDKCVSSHYSLDLFPVSK